MASKSSLVVFLFLVVVGASTFIAYPVLPVPNIGGQQIQNLGKQAVDEYNKKGNPHLEFIEVVNGSVVEVAYFEHLMYLELKAANCSQSGTEALYIAEYIYTLVYGPDGSRYEQQTTGSFYLK